MEKVSVSPAFGHGSVGPKATAKAALQGRSPYRALGVVDGIVQLPIGK